MVIEVLEDAQSHARAQSEFRKRFAETADLTTKAGIGFRGGLVEATVHWHAALGVWGSFNEFPIGDTSPRFWNAFGREDPAKHGSNLTITCEINPPHSGINRRAAGVFARDLSTGATLVLHRGKIGGGRKGIGADSFWRSWDQELTVEAIDGALVPRLALVASLRDPALPSQVASFVRRVAHIKSGDAGAPGHGISSTGYKPEFVGTKEYEASPGVLQEVNHGLVVDALFREVTGVGKQAGNDKARDLYVVTDAGQVSTLFEVKTTSTSTHIYGGVGQLMINGRANDPSVRLVLVIPLDSSTKSVTATLARIGMQVLAYRIEGKVVSFENVGRFL